jgi:eukaryotic-like serine/threonine-protein kinase
MGEELGHGKFGVVHTCIHAGAPPASQPEHALKRLKPEYLDDEELRIRFGREVEILASLDHPNLMKVVDHGEADDGTPYLVMPLAPGGSLRDAMADGRADDRDWWTREFRGVIEGVAHAHEHQIFHRDLKPRNILLFDHGPCVSDFGIAKQLDLDATTLTKSDQELGTLRYMAPEQFASVKDAGMPADVYALGKIFAHLITGITPEPMKVEVHKVPERFRFFVDKCCRDDPESRYRDGGEVLEGFWKSTGLHEIILPPDERLAELAEAAADSFGMLDEANALDDLNAHVRANRDHEKMNRDGIPYLPNELLRAWSAHNAGGFREAMEGYDAHISESGTLIFSYCDTVADFYEAVFRFTEDLAVKRLILNRLLDLGYSHNRFHVNGVVGNLVASLSDPTDVAIAEESILGQPEASAWYAEPVLNRPLAAPIANAFRSAQKLAD